MKARQDAMERSVLEFGRKETAREVQIVIHYVLELVSQICSRVSVSILNPIEHPNKHSI